EVFISEGIMPSRCLGATRKKWQGAAMRAATLPHPLPRKACATSPTLFPRKKACCTRKPALYSRSTVFTVRASLLTRPDLAGWIHDDAPLSPCHRAVGHSSPWPAGRGQVLRLQRHQNPLHRRGEGRTGPAYSWLLRQHADPVGAARHYPGARQGLSGDRAGQSWPRPERQAARSEAVRNGDGGGRRPATRPPQDPTGPRGGLLDGSVPHPEVSDQTPGAYADGHTG